MTDEPSSELPQSPDEIRAFMLWVLAGWDGTGDHSLQMKAEYARGTGPLIWSLANHTAELAHAVVATTSTAGPSRVLVVIPQVRLMLECATTAAWALAEPRAAGAILHEGLRQRKNAIDHVVKKGVEGFDQQSLADAMEVLEQFSDMKLPEGKHLEQRFAAIKSGDDLYQTYRYASALSHAGLGLVESYLKEVPRGPVVNPPGVFGDSIPWKDQSHGTTQQVSARAS